jgi:hypothetical protein
VADVTVTNTDNDVAGSHGHADVGPDDDRGGGTATFTVVLNTSRRRT